MNRTQIVGLTVGIMALCIIFFIIVSPPEYVSQQLQIQEQLEQQKVDESMQFFLDTQVKFKRHADGGCFGIWREYDEQGNNRFNITNVPLGLCKD